VAVVCVPRPGDEIARREVWRKLSCAPSVRGNIRDLDLATQGGAKAEGGPALARRRPSPLQRGPPPARGTRGAPRAHQERLLSRAKSTEKMQIAPCIFPVHTFPGV
jgi:hypothetical protein